jgi:hypothetical protein
MQVGGALGVAVVGSLLSTRYQDRVGSALASYHIPHAVREAILGSLGGALTVAKEIGGVSGDLLAAIARPAFISGMDLGLLVSAVVAVAGAALAFALLPSRAAPDAERPPAGQGLDGPADQALLSEGSAGPRSRDRDVSQG